MASEKSVDKPVDKDTKKQKIMTLSAVVLCALVLLPTTIVLSIGMIPSLVAYVTDKSKKKYRAISVASMNLAACFFFVLKLWGYGHSFYYTSVILTDPISIIIMYMGAASGYMIDWALSSTIGEILYSHAQSRLKEIEKKQKNLQKRWGLTPVEGGKDDKTRRSSRDEVYSDPLTE